MEIIGRVQDCTKQFIFEWKIEEFLSLSNKDGKYYYSPEFEFDEELWYLSVCPNGHLKGESIGYIGVFLYRKLCYPSKNLAWSFTLKTADGKKNYEKEISGIFAENKAWGCFKYLHRSVLLQNRSNLLPSDKLTIVCTIDFCSKYTDDTGDTVTAKCSYCKIDFHNDYLSSHVQKCLDKPIRCPTCNEEAALRNWFDHECEMVRAKAVGKLLDDLESILKTQEHSDLKIIVKGQEFKLHRTVLSGRNPYFKALLNTDMKEKTTGIVTIDDCEPDLFRSFIYFMYTGKVDSLSMESVCDLYKLADKYQEHQLKELCLSFMKKGMSVKTFYDFIVLALEHHEKELLNSAAELFCRETKEIICSVEWQSFMKQYSTQANELYIKAIDYKAQ